MSARIETFAKTHEGVALLEAHARFVIDGTIWQGFKGTAIKVDEDQLTDDELEASHDVDGTKIRVWKKRHDRIAERTARKQAEYSKRLTELRTERNAIVQNMKNDKELGIDPSPGDRIQIKIIDGKMERLANLMENPSLDLAGERSGEIPKHEELAIDEPDDEEVATPKPRVACQCGKMSPEGHKNPPMWLRGHKMRCKG